MWSARRFYACYVPPKQGTPIPAALNGRKPEAGPHHTMPKVAAAVRGLV